MSQSSFDDDDLFGEAADEMRDEVEGHLRAARASLPEADDVWETDADNVLGALNGLSAALDTGDAVEELRAAKKQYVLGERADAFEDADDLAEEIEQLQDLVETLDGAHERVNELTTTVPGLRSDLEEAHGEAGTDAETDEESDEGTEADADDADADEAEA
ncbi:DUF5790 family protein [Candidatus Halobonum tyrrellensis]|uniref:Uncharacterized protein n=1 Tax=Candidatus Halobonum tyrrellensis G22 TaxID=1324957 RepID=V4GVY8_9EURY|nr:DUF5790 family protein [Candidatus Halobonum tyrrellensis]ESP89296.1 hypothetical protein K933_04741 [Candidatus Halobonum tyrrellensis G22]